MNHFRVIPSSNRGEYEANGMSTTIFKIVVKM